VRGKERRLTRQKEPTLGGWSRDIQHKNKIKPNIQEKTTEEKKNRNGNGNRVGISLTKYVSAIKQLKTHYPGKETTRKEGTTVKSA
jgi:hypothetical protein